MTHPDPSPPPRAPDAILSELWEVKRQINLEADYRLENLVRMARASAAKIRDRQPQSDQALPDLRER
jgi:hypothetical protein